MSHFKYGLRDFKGLAIEKLWKDTQSYKVVRLDFSEVKPYLGFEYFRQEFYELLRARFVFLDLKAAGEDISSVTRQISERLREQENNSLVVLIDEYDAPLTACLDDPELFNKVRGLLSGFYAILKSNDQVLRFMFITGITKFTGIFSELNNLIDISLSPSYGTLLGFTRQEVQEYFDGYLNEFSEILGISRSDLLEQLSQHYDGFCFEETATQKVFTPWSLLKFFF